MCTGLIQCVITGKSLKDMEESLSSYGIKEGCKLMLIGKRVRTSHVLCFLHVSVYSDIRTDTGLLTEQS